MYFKLPSQKDADIEFEEKRDEKLYIKWQKRRNKYLMEKRENDDMCTSDLREIRPAGINKGS